MKSFTISTYFATFSPNKGHDSHFNPLLFTYFAYLRHLLIFSRITRQPPHRTLVPPQWGGTCPPPMPKSLLKTLRSKTKSKLAAELGPTQPHLVSFFPISLCKYLLLWCCVSKTIKNWLIVRLRGSFEYPNTLYTHKSGWQVFNGFLFFFAQRFFKEKL